MTEEEVLDWDYERPEVTQVIEQFGSHIEPPLESYWAQLEKLRWHAAVAEIRTGLIPIQVVERKLDLNVHLKDQSPFRFGIKFSPCQSPMWTTTYTQAWDFITHLMWGIEAYKYQLSDGFKEGLEGERS